MQIENFAAEVHQALHVTMYKKLLLALQHGLESEGYQFVPAEQASGCPVIPDELLDDVGAEVVKAKFLHVAPGIDREWLERRLDDAKKEGEAKLWASEIIHTLSLQGVSLARNPNFSASVGSPADVSDLSVGEAT